MNPSQLDTPEKRYTYLFDLCQRHYGQNAGDIAADVWLRTEQKITDSFFPRNPHGWYRAAAKNHWLNSQRKSEREIPTPPEDMVGADERALGSPMSHLLRVRLRELLRDAIALLCPSEQRRLEERLRAGGDRPDTWKGADDVAFCKATAKLRKNHVLRLAYMDCA